MPYMCDHPGCTEIHNPALVSLPDDIRDAALTLITTLTQGEHHE